MFLSFSIMSFISVKAFYFIFLFSTSLSCCLTLFLTTILQATTVFLLRSMIKKETCFNRISPSFAIRFRTLSIWNWMSAKLKRSICTRTGPDIGTAHSRKRATCTTVIWLSQYVASGSNRSSKWWERLTGLSEIRSHQEYCHCPLQNRIKQAWDMTENCLSCTHAMLVRQPLYRRRR